MKPNYYTICQIHTIILLFIRCMAFIWDVRIVYKPMVCRLHWFDIHSLDHLPRLINSLDFAADADIGRRTKSKIAQREC